MVTSGHSEPLGPWETSDLDNSCKNSLYEEIKTSKQKVRILLFVGPNYAFNLLIRFPEI